MERTGAGRFRGAIVAGVAALIYLGCAASPPALMDDVDAVQAQIARNMLDSGDWVTARLDGVAYLEKSPLIYWMMASSYAVFGPHAWAARLPLALSAILLCWFTYRFGAWAFSEAEGFYAGLTMATCIGLWLFTRIQIPDAVLTLTIAITMFAFLRAMEPDERRPRLWSLMAFAAIGVGLLLKGLIAALFPVAAAFLCLVFTRQLFVWETWRRLNPAVGIAAMLAISAPWHVLATLRNPPYFDWTMKSAPGQYHGFFWFYFLNEHVFRFLNMRYPRDYNTVARPLFWGFHLLWLFPWSAFVGGAFGLGAKPTDRAGRARLLLYCWAGFLMVFFTFSTTQEYYSMPCYPALAMLLGSAIARGGQARTIGSRVLAAVCASALGAIVFLLIAVWNTPAPGDISRALTQNPDAYTLSLGHLGDLTIQSFAYLRIPLMLAGLAFAVGTVAAWRFRPLGIAAMMVLFFHAARLALIAFDPYMGSKPLAEALKSAPAGQLIVDDQYYSFSSVFFYANRTALLLNGRVNNLEYASYAPGAPDVFLDDARFMAEWRSGGRQYLVIEKAKAVRFTKIADLPWHTVTESGGKLLVTNTPI